MGEERLPGLPLRNEEMTSEQYIKAASDLLQAAAAVRGSGCRGRFYDCEEADRLIAKAQVYAVLGSAQALRELAALTVATGSGEMELD